MKGPGPTSIGGASYVVSFLDDYSRFATIYILKSKLEVFSCFDHYKKRVENLMERKIKILRLDRGGEYVLDELKAYLNQSGISFERALADTPEHNSVAERFNQTLIERLRINLTGALIPSKLW